MQGRGEDARTRNGQQMQYAEIITFDGTCRKVVQVVYRILLWTDWCREPRTGYYCGVSAAAGRRRPLKIGLGNIML
jgi:hypothetical protein